MRQSNTSNNSSSLDEIFNTHNSHNNNFPATTIYGYNSGQKYSTENNNLKNSNYHLNSEDNFNYNHLGNHVEIYKDNSRDKDAFGFVSDLLKSKKN